MNKWKALAIAFTILTIGGAKETLRIFTSSAPDIASNRKGLMVMSLILMSLFIFLTIRFWRKASKKELY